MIFRPLLSDDRGCASYLLGSRSAGLCAVVDPHLAVREYVLEAADRGLKITHVIETHLHADHRSTADELAERCGARLGRHEGSEVRRPFTPLRDGDLLELGEVCVRVWHTPGHTPDSLCLLIEDRDRAEAPWFLLSGDTLLVGDVGRPDLGGEGAASLLYDSLQRLLGLDDVVEVYPAHYGGSACGGGALSGKFSSTIGFERRYNPALRCPSREAFVRYVTAGLRPMPEAFEALRRENLGET